MKQRYFLICLLAAGVVGGLGRFTFAAQTNQPNSGTNHLGHSQQFNSLTPEQREAMIKEMQKKHGLTNAPPSLTPQERRALKQQRIDELRHKQAEGTITPIERKQLQLLLTATNRPTSTFKQVHPPASTNRASTNFNFLSK